MSFAASWIEQKWWRAISGLNRLRTLVYNQEKSSLNNKSWRSMYDFRREDSYLLQIQQEYRTVINQDREQLLRESTNNTEFYHLLFRIPYICVDPDPIYWRLESVEMAMVESRQVLWPKSKA